MTSRSKGKPELRTRIKGSFDGAGQAWVTGKAGVTGQVEVTGVRLLAAGVALMRFFQRRDQGGQRLARSVKSS